MKSLTCGNDFFMEASGSTNDRGWADGSGESVDELFRPMYARMDRLFAAIMFIQAVVLVSLALWLTPLSWSGTRATVNVHVWAAAGLGAMITIFPGIMALVSPGHPATRLTMGISQSLVTALLIHISGGRIEMHFHAFVSLAFLAMYLDLKVIFAATVVLAADHLIRGYAWPQSVYGLRNSGFWLTLEHTVWILVEDLVLCFSITRMRRDRQALTTAVSRMRSCIRQMSGVAGSEGSEGDWIDSGLEQIREAMLRMRQSVVSVHDKTSLLSSTTSRAADIVNSSVSHADDSQADMERLRQCVQEIAAAVAEINSIAEQTRLLSLNATIEAARAAEGGAGFGVVARNVKELAVKSGTAADRICKLVSACVDRVGDASESTHSIVEQLREITSIVQSADEVIGEIRTSVSSSATEAEQIAAAFGVNKSRPPLISVTTRHLVN